MPAPLPIDDSRSLHAKQPLPCTLETTKTLLQYYSVDMLMHFLVFNLHIVLPPYGSNLIEYFSRNLKIIEDIGADKWNVPGV